MTGPVQRGAWVEVHRTVLEPGARAPQVPAETRAVPLELKVKGFLARDARVGEEVEIATPAGRTVRGTLVAADPAYAHGFGAPVPALARVGAELRAILRGRDR